MSLIKIIPIYEKGFITEAFFHYILFSYCCHMKLQEMAWLQTTQMCLTVLEARSVHMNALVCRMALPPEASKGTLFLSFLLLWLCSSPWFMVTSVFKSLRHSHTSLCPHIVLASSSTANSHSASLFILFHTIFAMPEAELYQEVPPSPFNLF